MVQFQGSRSAGTLIGPPLMSPQGQIELTLELEDRSSLEKVGTLGQKVILDIAYVESVPE